MVPLVVGIAAFMLTVAVNADMYMHNPRGSNNRQEETSRERKNANRLFDSQNNNRGGYNSGAGGMYYYAGSKLPIQWTNQHSCADPNNNCEIIIQYMCSNDLRDGTVTSTIRDSKQSNTEKRNKKYPSKSAGMKDEGGSKTQSACGASELSGFELRTLATVASQPRSRSSYFIYL